MFTWVEDIRELYRLNAARLEAWDETVPLALQPLDCPACHQALETQRSQRQACCEAPLQAPPLHLATQKVLSRLQNHWDGLTVFVGRPEVAMDKKSAERIRRNPVVGRKHYDGSGSVWSAHLAARLCSVLHTVWLWGLHPPHWLTACLQACAEHGGTCPTDLSLCLPWQMASARREARARPVPVTLPPGAGLCQEREEPEAADTS